MISVEQAQSIILDQAPLLHTVNVPLKQAGGAALANDIHAPFALPSFRQSAMDGYAIRLHESNRYHFIGEIQAGSLNNYVLQAGQAVRIFTGAALPDTADAVVMQEWVERVGEGIVIQEDKLVKPMDHIREIGEQLAQGALAFPRNTVLNPAAIGLLQSMGIMEVEVICFPTVQILVTGDELLPPGSELRRGQIYESNSITLTEALRQQHLCYLEPQHVKDDKQEIYNALEKALGNSDVLIISGGISVGDYDYVREALRGLDVDELFYKVNQKPGKPMFFGKKGDKMVFALPGNPAASLSCMYAYVIPALKKMSGYKNYLPLSFALPLTNEFMNKGERSKFLKAYVEDGSVTILDGQASSMLLAFSEANALVYIPKGNEPKKVGDLVKTILIQ